jgi:hypothetical protein
MLFTQAFLAFAATAIAAPAGSKLMTVEGETWTIENMKRICNEEDTSCTWNFAINTHAEGVEPTDAEYIVEASGGLPASRAIGGTSEFGIFTVTSTWSDWQGDESLGWTTMSVIDKERGVLVYPAYTDEQLASGEVVEPDQSYIPEPIPFKGF